MAAMRCHYEVMEVEQLASQDEIKKQYKKLALKWHPDKNTANPDIATERFKEITAAYTVLSDPQERAWYDDHRDSILRGDAVGEDVDEEGPLSNLWQYFNTSCFAGFSDDKGGFYDVYDTVFMNIHTVDTSRSLDRTDYVSFGNSSTDITDVLRFYSHWSNFVSELSFGWADKYNPNEAPNRQVKRAIEKENKKSREIARRKYIDTVRNLVLFVKRRDERLLRYEKEMKDKRAEEEVVKLKQKKLEEQRRKEQRELRKQQLENDTEEQHRRAQERKKAFLLADESEDSADEYVVADVEEESLAEVTAETIAEMTLQTEPTTIVPNYDCEICNKEFKTENQLLAHQASKVHRKKVTELTKQNKKKGGDKKKLNSDDS